MLCSFWIAFWNVLQSWPLLLFIMAYILMPVVAAAQPAENAFPDIPFKVFSYFVKKSFSSKITLYQVLLVLFTVIDNLGLLSLHARQQNPEYPDEMCSSDSGWIRGLAHAL